MVDTEEREYPNWKEEIATIEHSPTRWHKLRYFCSSVFAVLVDLVLLAADLDEGALDLTDFLMD
jgi:hypothetical protein